MEFVYWKVIWRVVVIRQTPRVEIFDSKIVVLTKTRRNMAKILPIRHKTLSSQSINQPKQFECNSREKGCIIFTLIPDVSQILVYGFFQCDLSWWWKLLFRYCTAVLGLKYCLCGKKTTLNNPSVVNRGVWKRACTVILS